MYLKKVEKEEPIEPKVSRRKEEGRKERRKQSLESIIKFRKVVGHKIST